MARKKTERKSKTFSEAIGINNIINDKTGFVMGLILLCVALFICIAFFSYFSTGQADQSLVTDLRPGEVENTGREFQNYCGSIGALLSYALISRCFGIPAFIIPMFIILCSVRMMGAYKKTEPLEMVLGHGFGDDMAIHYLCKVPHSTHGRPGFQPRRRPWCLLCAVHGKPYWTSRTGRYTCYYHDSLPYLHHI